MPIELVVAGLSKVFEGTRALEGVSFRATEGRVLALLGPSGCGKTTLLRVVAGLERATSGNVALDGSALDRVPPAARDVGFVFDGYALYPHLSAERNLTLSLEVRRPDPVDIAVRVSETAQLLGLTGLLAHHPAELSNVQRLRLAVGRALIRRPRLLLMDEPLSSVAPLERDEMRAELKALFRRFSAIVIYATDDPSEASSIADDVLVLKEGRVCQGVGSGELSGWRDLVTGADAVAARDRVGGKGRGFALRLGLDSSRGRRLEPGPD